MVATTPNREFTRVHLLTSHTAVLRLDIITSQMFSNRGNLFFDGEQRKNAISEIRAFCIPLDQNRYPKLAPSRTLRLTFHGVPFIIKPWTHASVSSGQLYFQIIPLFRRTMMHALYFLGLAKPVN